jgi:uncharacterized RDD family membrane protein YckC
VGTAKDIFTVATPEQVQLNYVLAGLGSRAMAFLLDTILRGLLVLCVFLGVLLLSSLLPSLTPIETLRHLGRTWLLALGFLAYGLVDLGYFLVFEALWSGQTPGKRRQGLRVIKVDGQPVGWLECSVRNILRALDMLAGIYPVGLVVMFLSRKNQRLGDYAAGTVVITERRRGTPRRRGETVSAEGLKYPEVEAQVYRLRQDQYEVLVSFLERREEMDPGHRREIARMLFRRLAAQWEMSSRQKVEEESFLEEVVRAYELKKRAV